MIQTTLSITLYDGKFDNRFEKQEEAQILLINYVCAAVSVLIQKPYHQKTFVLVISFLFLAQGSFEVHYGKFTTNATGMTHLHQITLILASLVTVSIHLSSGLPNGQLHKKISLL